MKKKIINYFYDEDYEHFTKKEIIVISIITVAIVLLITIPPYLYFKFS